MSAARRQDGRGADPPAERRDLAEALAWSQGGHGPAVGDDLGVSGHDHEHVVARGPLRHDDLPGVDVLVGHRRRQRRDRRHREGTEHVERLEVVEDDVLHHERVVEPAQHDPRAGHGGRGDQPHHQERAPVIDECDEPRHRDRPERHPEGEGRLQRGEEPAHDRVGDQALEQGEPGHVHDRVGDPHDGQQREGDAGLRHEREQCERKPPERDARAEVAGEARATDQEGGHEGPEHRAEAERGREQADAGLAEVEQLDRDHHDEDAEAPADEGLREDEAAQDTQRALAADHDEALLDVAHGVDGCDRLDARRRLVVDASDQPTGPPRGQAAPAKTPCTSRTATRAPAARGPRRALRESSRPRTTLAEVSAAGVLHSDGSNAEWAGR